MKVFNMIMILFGVMQGATAIPINQRRSGEYRGLVEYRRSPCNPRCTRNVPRPLWCVVCGCVCEAENWPTPKAILCQTSIWQCHIFSSCHIGNVSNVEKSSTK